MTVQKLFSSPLTGFHPVVFAFLFLFGLFPLEAQSSSNFTSVKLPRGIELQIPKNWWLLGEDFNNVIATSAEAVMDLSGIGLPEGNETNLIAANSMPRSTYAAVRVDSTVPPSVSLSDFGSMTATDVRELENLMRQLLLEMLPLQGNKLLDFLGSRIEKISGYPAIITEYRRSGPKGPVLVQINQIFTSSQEIRINLSYRESEVALWKAVLGKIRKSIIISHWP
ncbi:MAG: hypothetical protein ABI169_12735 [Chitinophagaceae bacterium]